MKHYYVRTVCLLPGIEGDDRFKENIMRSTRNN